MKITYLISPQSVKDVTNISDNLSEKYILTAIREAQQTELTTVLGVHFISTLEHLIETNEIGNPEHANIKFVLDNYISYFLIYNVIEKLIPLVSVKLDNAGAVMSENEDTENLSFSDMLKLQDYYRQKSDFYKQRLQKYLRNNRSMFGDLLCCSELDSAYSSPIFLGGKRGKHIIRPCECTCGHISPENPDEPEKPYYQLLYMVDGNVYDFASYQEGERIIPIAAPHMEGYEFQYWEGLPEYMPANDVTVNAYYKPVEVILYRTYDGQPIVIEGGITDLEGNPIQIIGNNWSEIEQAYELRIDYNPKDESDGWVLGETAFKENANLMSVDFSKANHLSTVNGRAFFRSGLKDVIFNHNLHTLLDGYTFYYCESLERVVLPVGLRNVGIAEFRGCKSLKEIVFSNGYDTNGTFTILESKLLVFNETGAMLAGVSNYLNYPEIKHIAEESLSGIFTSETTLYLPTTLESVGSWAISENIGINRIVYGGTCERFKAIVKTDSWFNGNQNPVILECTDGNYKYNWEADTYEIMVDTKQYTTFEALTDGVFSFQKRGFGDDIEYSKDNGATWTSLASGENVRVVTGDKVIWKSNLTPSAKSPYGIGRFASNCNFKVSGNIMSLAYGDDFEGQTNLEGKENIFYELFNKCTLLTDASELSLPATKLSKQCYRSMFCEASGLTKAPELPATTLVDSCYSWMFYKCTSLTSAPELPATTSPYACYSYMFAYCTSLTTAPELPATTLSDYCYQQMFYSCSSLTTAPELPATKLKTYCYSNMFNSCSKLNYIKMLATDVSAPNCLFLWTSNLPRKGTFVKHPDTQLPTSTSGIPDGWTVENITIERKTVTYTFYDKESGTYLPLSDLGLEGWDEPRSVEVGTEIPLPDLAPIFDNISVQYEWVGLPADGLMPDNDISVHVQLVN